MKPWIRIWPMKNFAIFSQLTVSNGSRNWNFNVKPEIVSLDILQMMIYMKYLLYQGRIFKILKWYKISHSLRNMCTRNNPSPVWVLKSVKVVPAKSKLLMRSMSTPNALAVPDDTNDPNWKTMMRCLGVSSEKVVEFLGSSSWFNLGLENCKDICKSVG